MKCMEFKKHINEFAEDTIDKAKSHEMEAHIEICSECRKEYENTKFIIDSMRKNVSTAALTERQRKDLKESILQAPIRKRRSFLGTLKNMMYAAAIFMFVTAGIYFSGGINVNIGPASSQNSSIQDNSSALQSQVEKLEAEKLRLLDDNMKLQEELLQLKKYSKDLESGKNKDWMMINQDIGEAIIEGRILSVDNNNKTIELEIFQDDNTPDIDNIISIPDGIFISNAAGAEEVGNYVVQPSTVADLKDGDVISIHYLGATKSARAIILHERQN